jgi:putative DNA primase/helicase
MDGGPNDDGLFQRFQFTVWPDPAREWKLIDRPPNAAALAAAEKVYSQLSNLSADDPIRMRFGREAQELFCTWLTGLETRIRTESLAPCLVAHLSKFRSLMPTLAALFELADTAVAGDMNAELSIVLDHARQAAALCDYLESHARRVYSCVISPECRAARELARHIQAGDLSDTFATRTVYLKGWAGLETPEQVRAALYLLEDAAWVRRAESGSSSSGGRPSELWIVNPRVVCHA